MVWLTSGGLVNFWRYGCLTNFWGLAVWRTLGVRRSGNFWWSGELLPVRRTDMHTQRSGGLAALTAVWRSGGTLTVWWQTGGISPAAYWLSSSPAALLVVRRSGDTFGILAVWRSGGLVATLAI